MAGQIPKGFKRTETGENTANIADVTTRSRQSGKRQGKQLIAMMVENARLRREHTVNMQQGYGQPPFGGSDLAGLSTQGYDQSQIPHSYGQPPFGGSDLAGLSTQGYDQSQTDNIGVRGRSNQELQNIAGVYIIAGNHKNLPKIYRKAIGEQPFTQQDLVGLRSNFRAAVNAGRISLDQERKLCKIVQQQSEAGKQKSRDYKQSEAGKQKRRDYEQSEAGKQKRRDYEQSEAGKQKNRNYEQSEAGKQKRRDYEQSEIGRASCRERG